MTRSSLDRQRHGTGLFGEGRLWLFLVSLSLILSGVFALYLAATRQFLPHDVHFLGLTAEQLCAVHGCRIVHFMIHDRIAFGGTLVAIGLLYGWLTAGPLRQRQAWAWWLLLGSGLTGFGSFFAYLGYGYLDSWHGLATLGLLPTFILGLARAHSVCPKKVSGTALHKKGVWNFQALRTPAFIGAAEFQTPFFCAGSCRWGKVPDTFFGPEGRRCLLRARVRAPWRSAAGLGRLFLLATAAGMVAGGLVIMIVRMTCVFVPQDLAFMGLGADELRAFNPRLVPLIAHDRAGFGGGACCCGIAVFFCVWCGQSSASLWSTLASVGLAGFGTAIGAHPAVGYEDAVHLAPAVLGAVAYSLGLILSFKPMFWGTERGMREARHAANAYAQGHVPTGRHSLRRWPTCLRPEVSAELTNALPVWLPRVD